MNKLIDLIKNNIVLAKSISYLGIIQIANFALPLVAIPYIIRVVGLDKYGLISLSQAIALYLNILVEYGFNYSATKEISVNRNNKDEINKIFTSVILIKLLFFFIILVLYSAIIFIIPKLREDYILYIIGYLIVFGLAIFPIWLFQGLEKLKHITIANTIGKLLMVMSIFIFIKTSSDYVKVIYIYAIGYILTGVLSLIFTFKYEITFVKVSFYDIKKQLFQGYNIFISSIGISLYRNVNIIIVSYFSSNELIGIYSLSEKLVKTVQSLVNPITQAIFPSASKKIDSIGITMGKEYVSNIVGNFKWILLFLFSVLLISSPLLSIIFLGEYNKLFFIILSIISPVIIFGGLNYVYGVIGLINFGKEKKFSKAIYLGALINIVVGAIGGYCFGAVGVASAISIAELSILLILRKEFSLI